MTALPWTLWSRQAAAVMRLELEKNFFSRRLWWLLAAVPVLLTAAHSYFAGPGSGSGRFPCTLGQDLQAYAVIFQMYYLRLGIFFGCVGIFANLFRGEMLEKTLHYYLLTPLRREILAVGKFAAGLVTAISFFAGGVALSYVLIHHSPAHWEHLWRGPGLSQLGWYTLIAALACAAYGAVFTFLGLVFKNPTIAAFVVMVWEGINPFLPAFFKKLSVIFFLKGMCPVEVPLAGPSALFGLVADPTPAWLAIPGLLLLAVAGMVFAALYVRKLEINYSE